ncbi:hypothetical protein [uncultured Methanobrevibacter sp.]|uniref:hypothetical protein n=1 Tax=uncultured Methanobrevibacter sp. TaxID=253161 RepID=UPI0025DFB602|nr:hypothetical protein [uncultured Methanobrevibacter sp.]
MREIDESKYPMTEEEFIKRIKELYLEHSTWDMPTKLGYINSEQGLEDMKIEYIDSCGYYDRYVNDYPDYPNIAFEECGLLSCVSDLDRLTEFY